MAIDEWDALDAVREYMDWSYRRILPLSSEGYDAWATHSRGAGSSTATLDEVASALTDSWPRVINLVHWIDWTSTDDPLADTSEQTETGYLIRRHANGEDLGTPPFPRSLSSDDFAAALRFDRHVLFAERLLNVKCSTGLPCLVASGTATALVAAIWKGVLSLRPNEHDLLEALYGLLATEPQSLEDLAGDRDITFEAAWQLERMAMAKLLHPHRRQNVESAFRRLITECESQPRHLVDPGCCGRSIRRERLHRGWTEWKLAEEASNYFETSPTDVANLELGGYSTRPTLMAILCVLNLLTPVAPRAL